MRQSRIWIGSAISLAFLVALMLRVDRAELLLALRAVDPVWLLPALAVFALSIWVRVLRWHAILARVTPIPVADAGELLVIGCAANNILPARTGEIVRAVLLQRRHGGSMVTALSTIVVERLFDGLILALMLATSLAFLGGNALLQRGAALAGLGFGSIAVVLISLAIWPRPTRRLIDAILSAFPASIGSRLSAVSERFLDGLAALGSLRTWAIVVAASLLTWSFEAAAYAIVGHAFGLSLSPLVYFAICSAANLTVAIPSTSGAIGPYEYLVVVVVTAFSAIGESAATAYAIGLHLFVLLPLTLLGVFLLWRRDLGLGDLARPDAIEVPRESTMEVAP